MREHRKEEGPLFFGSALALYISRILPTVALENTIVC